MSQIRITKPRRAASAGRRGREEPPLPLDLRDPDIIRAKRLQRRARRRLAPGPADHGLLALLTSWCDVMLWNENAMTIEHVLAVVPVADFGAAHEWYERFFGRPADNLPMEGRLVEWRVTGSGWVQVTSTPLARLSPAESRGGRPGPPHRRSRREGLGPRSDRDGEQRRPAVRDHRPRRQHDHLHRQLPDQILSHPFLPLSPLGPTRGSLTSYWDCWVNGRCARHRHRRNRTRARGASPGRAPVPRLLRQSEYNDRRQICPHAKRSLIAYMTTE